MFYRSLFAVPVCILMFSGMTHSVSSAENGGEVPSWCQVMRNHVSQWCQSGSVVGAELLIIKGDREILHDVWGWDEPESKRKLEKDKIFRLRSMTKPFIGTAILMLEEQKKLSLEDRVSKYLSCFDNDKSRGIKIAHLLYHTSGFTMGYPAGSIDDYSGLQEAVIDAAEKGPKYKTGEEYHYADADSAALGLIIQAVTGDSPEEFIHKKILEPLGMKDTYCLLKKDAPDRKDVCNTHIWKEGKYVKFWDHEAPPETPFFRCSGGLYGTARDYARFLKIWMNRGTSGDVELIQPKTVEKALVPGQLYPRYGMHWEIFHSMDKPGKQPVFGHGGSDGTVAIALPEQDAMVFYFTQSRGTLSTMFFEKLLLQELGYIKKKDIPDVTISEKTFNAVEGDYQMGKEVWTVERSGDGINYRVDRLVPLHFEPVSQTEFVHPVLDMKVKFDLKEDGTCDSLIFNTQNQDVPAKRIKLQE